MSKEKNKTMTPKLRFPEFREAGEWKVEPFDKLYSFYVTNSFSRDDLNYTKGKVKNIHYGDIHTKFDTLFDIKKEKVPYVNPSISIDKIKKESYCTEGDMIFADASEDLNDVGKSIEIISLNNEKLLSGLHTLLARQIVPKLVIGFGGHLFKSEGIRSQIQREAQGAKVLGISAGRLSNIKVYYPENKPEQQKIATTLSSLDDLIAAQSQKIKALQTHKKGLMQLLFPAEGERTPRVRFGEFEDSGEWEESKLEELSDIKRGAASQHLNYVENDFPNSIRLLRINDFLNNDAVYVEDTPDMKRFRVRTNDILIAGTGATAGITFMIEDNFNDLAYSYNAPRIRVKSANCHFIFHYLKSDSIVQQQKKMFVGNAQPFLDTTSIGNLRLSIPSAAEQQKIAATLSSLDDLITTQTQKLEALKMHKKGLMQQLFPNPNHETL